MECRVLFLTVCRGTNILGDIFAFSIYYIHVIAL